MAGSYSLVVCSGPFVLRNWAGSSEGPPQGESRCHYHGHLFWREREENSVLLSVVSCLGCGKEEALECPHSDSSTVLESRFANYGLLIQALQVEYISHYYLLDSSRLVGVANDFFYSTVRSRRKAESELTRGPCETVPHAL